MRKNSHQRSLGPKKSDWWNNDRMGWAIFAVRSFGLSGKGLGTKQWMASHF